MMGEKHMVDFHIHLLSGVDDGARDTLESVNLLQSLGKQKVKMAIATPHFIIREAVEAKSLLEKRNQSAELLRRHLDKAKKMGVEIKVPSVLLGAEVRIIKDISKLDILEKLCIEGTDRILLEFPWECPFDDWVWQEVMDICDRRRLKPILAHPERFVKNNDDINKMLDYLKTGIFVQFNATSIIGDYQSIVSQRMLEVTDRYVLGTDAHNMVTRKPYFDKARERLSVITRFSSEEILERNTKIILKDVLNAKKA